MHDFSASRTMFHNGMEYALRRTSMFTLRDARSENAKRAARIQYRSQHISAGTWRDASAQIQWQVTRGEAQALPRVTQFRVKMRAKTLSYTFEINTSSTTDVVVYIRKQQELNNRRCCMRSKSAGAPQQMLLHTFEIGRRKPIVGRCNVISGPIVVSR